MKRLFGIAAIAALAVAGYFAVTREKGGSKPSPDLYRSIESKVELNADQQKELVTAKSGTRIVYRAQEGAVWQIHLGGNSPGEELGQLFAAAQAPEVSTPVYLCRFQLGEKPNLALDSTANCSGEGSPEGPQPAGYVSEKIRTGFLLLARCKSATLGFYNTLNLHCENAADTLQTVLGAIRAAH